MVSIVGTTTSSDGCVAQSFQHKVFYANGLFWAWYIATTQFGWKTSADGITWSAFTNFGPYFPERCDIWYDETNNKICISYADGNNQPVYYRQGTANADGTITWDSALVSAGDIHTYYSSLCKDSNGYPWIAYQRRNYTYKVVKATAVDGSAWGSPVTLWTTSSNYGRIAIVPLTGGKMLAVFCNCCGSGAHIQSRLFNGSTWEAAVTADTTGYANGSYFCVVADGDNAHLAYNESDTYDIIYIKYVSGSWGSEETVEAGTTSKRHPALTLKSTNKVRVYYFSALTNGNRNIKSRDRDDGAWQTAVVIDEVVSATCLSSSYKPFSDYFGVIWKDGSGSPYNVMFALGYIIGGDGEVVIDDEIGNALTFDAIEWRERQNCRVAVRNIPLRTTGSFVDTGTWTLRNRRLYITARFTDADKTTLQTIFDGHIEVTITAGDWTYTGWFVMKPLVYEYSKDGDGNEREWIVEMEFALSSFSYSP